MNSLCTLLSFPVNPNLRKKGREGGWGEEEGIQSIKKQPKRRQAAKVSVLSVTHPISIGHPLFLFFLCVCFFLFHLFTFILFQRDLACWLLEGGEGREKERERNISV